MQVLNTLSFLDCLSQPRVKSYQDFFYPGGLPHHDDDLAYMYLWNNEISEIFWKVIPLIEITMRNKLHKELSSVYFSHPKMIVGNGFFQNQFATNKISTPTIGTFNSCNWYHAVNFTGEALSSITKRTHFKKPNNKFYRKTYAVTPDDVISGLTFGFWRFLFKNLGTAGVAYQNIVSEIFRYSPFYRQTVTPSLDFKLDRRIEMIHSFRNRVSHHEPVWKLKDMMEEKITPIPGNANNINVKKSKPLNKDDSFEHLVDYYQMMIEYLQWLDRDLAKSFKVSWWNDRFLFLCSDRGVNSLLRTHSGEVNLSRSVFKRDIKGVMSKGRSKIILDGKRKAIFIPLK